MDHEFLKLAIQLAVDNVKSGKGGPFGAVIVKDGAVLATGANSVTTSHDPTMHAEIAAIRNACEKLSTFQLEGCTIYSSCEPCPMCLGAIYWARPERLVFAASKHDAAEVGFDDSLIYQEIVLDYGSRKIPTEQMLQIEGKAPFEAWRRFDQRIDY